MKQNLLHIAYRQKEQLGFRTRLIERDCMAQAREALLSDNRVLIVTGMRRVGKSTLVRQLLNTVETFCYFNFEDEKLLDFSVDQFGELEEVLIEVYGASKYYFFDEIQNIPQFEVAIRRLQDGGKKIVLTGSNSSMLSMEFGDRLTGRYKQIELFPFSFAEYLRFQDVVVQPKDFHLAEPRVLLKNQCQQWLESGGLPEYLHFNDPDYVRTLFDNILYRDILTRYGIKRHREFRELIQLLATNLALPVTFSSLQKSIGLSNSETVKQYMGYLSNSYMFFELYQYHPSIKKQLNSPRKVYLNDVAFHNLVGFTISQNSGRKLENAVYLHLRRHSAGLFSFQGKGECDFVAFDHQRRPAAIQVCHELHPGNEKREMDGLLEAMQAIHLEQGTIVTLDQERLLTRGSHQVSVIPVWKWLLMAVPDNLSL